MNKKTNYTVNSPLADIWCPECWSITRYIGGGAHGCEKHGEVKPISLCEILPKLNPKPIE